MIARPAAYGRYTTNGQQLTSIEDQIRRARDVAAARGLVIPDSAVYSDAAMKGSDLTRPNYQRLLADWRAGKFTHVFADEQTRFFRDEREALDIKELIKTSGVHVITACGIDTRSPSWELLWGFKATMGSYELTQIAFRVKRSMEGAVLRNRAVSAPPYGYDAVMSLGPAGGRVGTHWVVNEERAAIVRRIFAERYAGSSYNDIAAGLNADGVPASKGGRWNPSSIVNILVNKTYAGVVVFRGSRTRVARAAQGKACAHEKIIEHPRPDLRIVDPAVFEKVAPGHSSVTKSGRGGGKFWASGLVHCGCGCTMTVKESKVGTSLYCSKCARNKRLGEDVSAPYVSVPVLQELLTRSLEAILSDDSVRAVLRARLEARLSGGSKEELARAQARVSVADRALRNAVKQVARLDEDADDYQELLALFEEELDQARAQRKAAEADVQRLVAGQELASPADIERQLAADPRELVGLLFAEASPAALRAVLNRLFPEIVMEGRPVANKREATFSITVSPGVALALVSRTPQLDESTVVRRFAVLSSSRKDTAPTILPLLADGTISPAAELCCRVCSKTKPLSDFPSSYRKYARCIQCRGEANRMYHLARQAKKEAK